MKVIATSPNTHILRFDVDEEALSALKEYCLEHNITAGHFTAIGATKTMDLAWYDTDRKEYDVKTYEGLWEIAGVIGNIAVSDDELIIHAHGVFSTMDQTVAAHIMSMTVGGACEVAVTVLPGKLKREYDDKTGLKLLS